MMIHMYCLSRKISEDNYLLQAYHIMKSMEEEKIKNHRK